MKNKKQLFMTLLMTAVMTFGGTATQKAWGDEVGTLVKATSELTAGTFIYLKTDATNSGNNPTTPYFNGSDAKVSSVTGNQIYKLVSDNGMKLQRCTDGKYVSKNSNAIVMDDSGVAFTFSIPKNGGSYVSGADNDYMIRFTTSSTFINAQGDNAAAKYATGTGSWSVWSVYKCSTTQYTVSCSTTDDGGINFMGTDYKNGESLTIPSCLTSSDLTAIAVAGKDAKIEISGETITVTYEQVVTITYTLTDNVGNTYPAGSYQTLWKGDKTTEPTFTGCNGLTLLDGQFENSGETYTYTATVNFPMPVSNINGTTNYVTIDAFSTNTGTKNYWYSSNTDIVEKRNTSLPTDKTIKNFLWAVYPVLDGSTFYFNIKNIGTSTYIYTTATSESHNQGTVTLNSTSKTNLTYDENSQWKYGDFYLSINSNNTDNLQYLGIWKSSHGGTKNVIQAVEHYVVKPSSTYSTLCLPYASIIPDGVTAFYASALTSTVVTLNSFDGIIPTNCGVVIKGTADQTYDFIKTSGGTTPSTNYLVGVTESKNMNSIGNAYVLYPNGMFYLCSGGNLAANKAYLDGSSLSGSAPSFTISFDDEETSIECVEYASTGSATTIYNLAGQRVNTLQKGINIVNGKKVLY